MSDTERNLLEEAFVQIPEQEAIEDKIQLLQQQLEAIANEKTGLEYKLNQSREREVKLGRSLRKERAMREKDRLQYEYDLQNMFVRKKRSFVLPGVMMAAFITLSILAGVCVDRGWMIALLGELLICAFLCVCSFFAGLLWTRLKG